jgi:hypothetical protein
MCPSPVWLCVLYLSGIVKVCLLIEGFPYSHLYTECVDVKFLISMILVLDQATSIIIYANLVTVLVDSMSSVHMSEYV